MVNLIYSNRPGRDFYGVGNLSERDDQTNFYEERAFLNLWAKRRLYGSFWVGAGVQARHEFIGNGEGDWSPNTFSKNWFPDMMGKGEWWNNSISLSLMHDTKNENANPTKGGFRAIAYSSQPAWMGGDFTFETWGLDLRQYIALRKLRKDTLALRFQAVHTEGGPIPFYEMPVAGNAWTLRGYKDGRWRDRDTAVANFELRHNLWKAFDVNVFYDIGRVYGDMFQEGEHLLTDLHDAYGWGFRVQMPPNLILRLDFGFSKTDSTFYLDFGQTF